MKKLNILVLFSTLFLANNSYVVGAPNELKSNDVESLQSLCLKELIPNVHKADSCENHLRYTDSDLPDTVKEQAAQIIRKDGFPDIFWDKKDLTRNKVEPELEAITEVAVSPDGRFLATCTNEYLVPMGGQFSSVQPGRFKILNLENENIELEMPMERQINLEGNMVRITPRCISGPVFSSDGNRVAFLFRTINDQTISVYDRRGTQWFPVVNGPWNDREGYRSRILSPDGSILTANFFDEDDNRRSHIYRFDGNGWVEDRFLGFNKLRSYSFSPDNRMLIVKRTDTEDGGYLLYHSTEAGIWKPVPNIPWGNKKVIELSFSSDAKTLIVNVEDSSDGDGFCYIYNITSDGEFNAIEAPWGEGKALSASLSSNGKYIAATFDKGKKADSGQFELFDEKTEGYTGGVLQWGLNDKTLIVGKLLYQFGASKNMVEINLLPEGEEVESITTVGQEGVLIKSASTRWWLCEPNDKGIAFTLEETMKAVYDDSLQKFEAEINEERRRRIEEAKNHGNRVNELAEEAKQRRLEIEKFEQEKSEIPERVAARAREIIAERQQKEDFHRRGEAISTSRP